MEKTLKTFISYSHDNVNLKQRFETHLVPLAREFGIEIWSDNQLQPGQEWYLKINENFESSSLIFLLLTPDFIASKQCLRELDMAMEMYKKGKAWVVPIVLQQCAWDNLKITSLQLSPTSEGRVKPVSEWSDQDSAFNQIRLQLKPLIDQIVQKVNNSDIHSRIAEIEMLVQNAELKQALLRTLDTIKEFGGDKELMKRVSRASLTYNMIEKERNGQPMSEIHWKKIEEVGEDILATIVFFIQ